MFLTSLSHSLLSDIIHSHAFSKMLPLVCSGMESLELLPTSFFVMAITASWKMTRAAAASLYFKEMSSSTRSMIWQRFWMVSTLASKSCWAADTLLRISMAWDWNILISITWISAKFNLACNCPINSSCCLICDWLVWATYCVCLRSYLSRSIYFLSNALAFSIPVFAWSLAATSVVANLSSNVLIKRFFSLQLFF